MRVGSRAADPLDASPTEPWKQLTPGDLIEVHSRRDASHIYSLTFLAIGSKAVGLYVRLSDGKLGRLDPGRVDWSTLKQVGSGSPVLADWA